MRLFIRTLQGQNLIYDVGLHDSVWSVLKMVPRGLLPADHGVCFRGQRLDLSRRLSSYEIGQDAVLSAVGAPRVRGTQQRKRRKRQMDEAIVPRGAAGQPTS